MSTATRTRWRIPVAFCLGLATLGTTPSHGAGRAQLVYPSAEQAAAALIDADRANDLAALARILGPGARQLTASGDAIADRAWRTKFVTAYDEAHRIESETSDKAILVVGKEEWPLPIPLLHEGAGWRFDTPAAEQEILNRRIGRNELNVIEVAHAYVEAQREFAALRARSAAPREYALHFMSHAGQHDGLYWPTAAGEPESPLGPLVAQARAGGYAADPARGKSQPYHGYYFRILTSQGAHAPGGARDYVVGGHMTGGFALLAYPARYADSGVMTFLVDQSGVVFEKNLGRETAILARAIDRYDPDPTWRAAPSPVPRAAR